MITKHNSLHHVWIMLVTVLMFFTICQLFCETYSNFSSVCDQTHTILIKLLEINSNFSSVCDQTHTILIKLLGTNYVTFLQIVFNYFIV